jgi:hypothetical protein
LCFSVDIWFLTATGSSDNVEGLGARAERKEPREEGLDRGRGAGEATEYETDIHSWIKEKKKVDESERSDTKLLKTTAKNKTKV